MIRTSRSSGARWMISIGISCTLMLLQFIYPTLAGADSSLSVTSSTTNCGVSSPLPAVVKFGILMFCEGPIGIMEDASSNLALKCHPGGLERTATALAFSLAKIYLGIDMYVQEMTKQQPIPLRGGKDVSFSFTYINLGYIDWAAVNYTDFTRIWGGEAPSSNGENQLAWDIAMTEKHGGPYPFLIPPPFISASGLTILNNICEDNMACMVLGPWTSASNLIICSGDPLPADCQRRGKVAGERRFGNFLSVFFDTSAVTYSALETYHVLNVKSLVLISEDSYFTPFVKDALIKTLDYASTLGMSVLGTSSFVRCDPYTLNPDTNQTNCPKNGHQTPMKGQSQILPDGHTPVTYAQWLKDLNPDAITLIGSMGGQSGHAFASLFDGFRAVGYTPKMINIAGGVDASILPYLTDPSDLLYTWTTQPWDYRLSGPQYRNLKTPSNFELFPAEAGNMTQTTTTTTTNSATVGGSSSSSSSSTTLQTAKFLDGPQVYAREFSRRYARFFPEDNALDFKDTGSMATIVGFQALTFGQKLIESALSSSIPELVTASAKLSFPSIYHQLQFDPFGRTVTVNQVLLQYVPPVEADERGSGVKKNLQDVSLVAPYNIAGPSIFPLPTWEEREFHPRMYQDTMEQLMAGLTGSGIIVCLLVGLGLLINSKHLAIRAATPSFCLLTILGAVTMLSSNFFHTLVASDSHCAAQIWLLSIGFTLLFSSLFIKTFRIGRLTVGSRQLVPRRRMKDLDMLIAVFLFVAVDVLINAIWQGMVGMKSQLILIDPLRPSFNQLVCDYTDAMPFVYTHLALKSGLLVGGVALTWMVRGAPTTFNESSYIGICIYNVSLVSCFVLPLLSAQTGGRSVYLLRAYAILFVCLSTVCVLYIPKLLTIYLVSRPLTPQEVSRLQQNHHPHGGNRSNQKSRPLHSPENSSLPHQRDPGQEASTSPGTFDEMHRAKTSSVDQRVGIHGELGENGDNYSSILAGGIPSFGSGLGVSSLEHPHHHHARVGRSSHVLSPVETHNTGLSLLSLPVPLPPNNSFIDPTPVTIRLGPHIRLALAAASSPPTGALATHNHADADAPAALNLEPDLHESVRRAEAEESVPLTPFGKGSPRNALEDSPFQAVDHSSIPVEGCMVELGAIDLTLPPRPVRQDEPAIPQQPLPSVPEALPEAARSSPEPSYSSPPLTVVIEQPTTHDTNAPHDVSLST